MTAELKRSKVPAIAIVAVVSFLLWLLPLILGKAPTNEVPMSLGWLVLLALVIGSMAYAEHYRTQKMQTLFIGDQEGLCIGYGSFHYENHIDLIEQCLFAMGKATIETKPHAATPRFNARYVIKTKSFTAGYVGSFKHTNPKSEKLVSGLMGIEDPIKEINLHEATKANEISVQSWTGSVETIDGSKRWDFKSIDELEAILSNLI